MKHWWFGSIAVFVLAVVLLVPIFNYDQNPTVYAQEPLLADEWMELHRDLAEWQSDTFLQSLDIIEAGLQEANAVASELAGSIDLPDLASTRADVLSLVSAVDSALDHTQSREALS